MIARWLRARLGHAGTTRPQPGARNAVLTREWLSSSLIGSLTHPRLRFSFEPAVLRRDELLK
jgi:hypothetical protein